MKSRSLRAIIQCFEDTPTEEDYAILLRRKEDLLACILFDVDRFKSMDVKEALTKWASQYGSPGTHPEPDIFWSYDSTSGTRLKASWVHWWRQEILSDYYRLEELLSISR